jgi:anti-anti-sigma factor
MPFAKEEKNGIVIIKIENQRLDAMIASDLKTELLLTVDGGANKILMDLSEVTYADSSGLGALLFGLRQLHNIGGQMSLYGANKKVLSLIKIARLEDRLVNYENRKEALENFFNE